jgi:predicted naringenin-chalcone synthase
VGQQRLWDEFFDQHFSGNRIARRVFSSSSVEVRHAVANPLAENISGWSTGQRMARFSQDAMPLGKDAVASALSAARLDASEVGMFVVTSCTGYATPGLDILLARDLGMPADVQRLCIGHMGCYAAIPSLGAAADFVAARQRPAVLLCLELTSLHLQPPTDDVEQIVAHALFSDAASAVVVAPAGAGLALIDVAASTDVANAALMTWDVTDHGFRMGLSPRVPDVLALHVRRVVDELLERHHLTVADVTGWAVHPGGPRILDVVAEQLGLAESTLQASRTVLREHGNCSSATVLMVLDELTRTSPVAAGGHVVALAFGPGLTLYAALLTAQA